MSFESLSDILPTDQNNHQNNSEREDQQLVMQQHLFNQQNQIQQLQLQLHQQQQTNHFTRPLVQQQISEKDKPTIDIELICSFFSTVSSTPRKVQFYLKRESSLKEFKAILLDEVSAFSIDSIFWMRPVENTDKFDQMYITSDLSFQSFHRFHCKQSVASISIDYTTQKQKKTPNKRKSTEDETTTLTPSSESSPKKPKPTPPPGETQQQEQSSSTILTAVGQQ